MLDARSLMLAKKGVIPYSIPAKDGISASLQQVSRNQYPVSSIQYLGPMKLRLLFMAMKR
jgi:hypothetical protein